MPLIFSGLTGHSSALLPGLATSRSPVLQSAKQHEQQITAALIAARPDILIVISQHGPANDLGPTVNIGPKLSAGFSEFGDMSSKLTISGASQFASELREALWPAVRLNFSSRPIDYATALPLLGIASQFSGRLLPLHPSKQSLEANFNFGLKLGQFIKQQRRLIGILGSLNLSHKLNRKSPYGYSRSAAWFDKQVINAVKNKDWSTLANINPEISQEVGEQALPGLAILLGVMSNYSADFQQIGYEQPVGIGWLYGLFI